MLTQERKRRVKEINMLVHQMLCMSESSPDVINITDLTELCACWTSETELGAEVHHLLEAVKERNLRQRCTEKKQLTLDVVNWLKHVGGEPCLTRELFKVLSQQFLLDNSQGQAPTFVKVQNPYQTLQAKLTCVEDEGS